MRAAAAISGPVTCPGSPALCGTRITSAPSASTCALWAVPRRPRDDARVPERSAHDCEACTHVTARHLSHWRARLEAPIGTRCLDDGARGAILDAARRLQELCLG